MGGARMEIYRGRTHSMVVIPILLTIGPHYCDEPQADFFIVHPDLCSYVVYSRKKAY
ncbi:hypothetical protein ACFLRM_00665 [Acidobacteriota bacterium]